MTARLFHFGCRSAAAMAFCFLAHSESVLANEAAPAAKQAAAAEEEETATQLTAPAVATNRTEIFRANDEWKAIDWVPMTIVKGSALDASGYLDAPAGKYGEIIARNGSFVFTDSPGQPVHFYGTNVTHQLPYLDKQRCEQLVDYLAASGYNLVRLHNFNFVNTSLNSGPGALDFNPERLDQFDYLLFCLKKKGIYYTMPINPWGFFKAGDVKDVKEFADRNFRFEFSGLLPISNDLMTWLKQYSTNFLTRKNAYTGLALKDDPALASLEITNENALFAVMGHHPEFVPILRGRCAIGLKEKLGVEPTKEQINKFLPEYLVGLHEKTYQTVRDHLHQIGVEKPLTDISHRANMIYALPRSRQDYVDIHGYWDLYKTFPGQKISDAGDPPYRVSAKNPNKENWGNVIPVLAAARLFDLPFASGEFSSNYPTPYWAFSGPGEAIFASLQGWSSVIRYAQMPFPDRAFKAAAVVRVESGGNPLVMFSERIASLLFAQHEVAVLPTRIPLVVTPEYLLAQGDEKGGGSPPQPYSRLVFQYQLGTILLDGTEKLDGYPCFVAPPGMKLPPSMAGKKVFQANSRLAADLQDFLKDAGTSIANPWKLDAQSGLARIVTTRSETFLLPPELGAAAGQTVSVSGNTTVAVCSAISIDGAPLAASRRILALYLTDLKNSETEIEYDRDGAMIVRKYGKLPLLIRQGEVRFSFKMKGRPLPEIWALKYNGERSTKLEPHSTEEGFSFDARSVTNPETFSTFELVWN